MNRLDSEIKKYSDRNIGVPLSVYLSRTGNESVDSALVHPEAGASGRCAFGVSKEALAYLRFFCEFVSERYGLSDSEIKIQSVIFFENATSCYENCDMGKQTLKDFVEAYSLSFRVLYNAIRSNSPGVAIFTGVSRVWDADLPFDRYSRFDARAFLDCFNACVSDRGNIGWGVALDPYPSGKNDYYSSEDQTLTGRFDTDSVGVSNLEVLCDYLGRDALLFDLAKRDIAVVENTSFTGNAEKVLADHVFTFYKTASEDVGLYITDRKLADTEVLKYMDTSRSLRNTYFALELLGIADWKSGIRNFSNEKIAQRTVAEGTVLSDTPEHKGSGTLFGFAEGKDEAIGYKGSETVSFESGVGDMERCLSLTPEYMGAKDRCGVILKLPSGLDMRYLQYVRLSVSAMSFPTNVQNVKLRLTLYSGADVCEAETVIKKTTKNTLIFDFSGFEKLSGVSMMSLTFEPAGDKALGEPQFLISPVEVLSKEYTDIEIAGLFGEEKTEYSFLSELTPERLAAASAGIGVIAAAALTVRAVRRKKRNRAETEDRA